MFPGYFGASPSETEGLTARAGTRLDTSTTPVAAREAVIDAVREVTTDDPEDRWFRIPLFLHLRAVLAA